MIISHDDYMAWISNHSKCWVTVGNKRRLGHIMKINAYTVWVKIMNGARTSFTIKRHITKHNVRWR